MAMQMQIEQTDQITTIDGAQARVWKGTTTGGIECFVFVTRIAVHKDANPAEFERELMEKGVPREACRAIPLSMIL